MKTQITCLKALNDGKICDAAINSLDITHSYLYCQLQAQSLVRKHPAGWINIFACIPAARSHGGQATSLRIFYSWRWFLPHKMHSVVFRNVEKTLLFCSVIKKHRPLLWLHSQKTSPNHGPIRDHCLISPCTHKVALFLCAYACLGTLIIFKTLWTPEIGGTWGELEK